MAPLAQKPHLILRGMIVAKYIPMFKNFDDFFAIIDEACIACVYARNILDEQSRKKPCKISAIWPVNENLVQKYCPRCMSYVKILSLLHAS